MDKLDKRPKYDDAFKAEALRLARESRSTQAAARALNHRPQTYLTVAATGAGAAASRPQGGR